MDYTDAKNPNWERNWLNINPQKTAEIIASTGADIVGLNEIYNSGVPTLEKQAETLANLAGYPEHAFGLALRFHEIKTYGNGALSKFKILESETIPVPAPVGAERRDGENEYYEDRAILRLVVDICGTPVSVYITHFGLNPLEQERMVDKLCKRIDDEKNPHILMGDFNNEPYAPVLSPIFSRMKSLAKETGNTQKTFSTYEESIQIDYIFVSEHFEIKSFTRIEANASDHYPILGEVTLKF